MVLQGTRQELTVALQSNCIRSLPRFLFSLDNITVLNLWNNRIRELPAEIALMRALKILVVGRNELETIPGEIRSLSNLERVTLHPNPFLSKKKNQNTKLDIMETQRRNHGGIIPSLTELSAREVIRNQRKIMPKNIVYYIPFAIQELLLNHVPECNQCQKCRGPIVREWNSIIRWESIHGFHDIPLLYRFCGINCIHLFTNSV